MADPSTVWRVRRGAGVWREVDGEIVLLDLEHKAYVGINGSGAVLWRALVEGATRPELADLLSRTYALAAEDAEQQVADFVEACRARDLLEG